MVKQGKKSRGQHHSPTPENSPMKTRVASRHGSSLPIESDVAITPHPNFMANRNKPRSNIEGMDSFDTIHSPFFLHSGDHPGLCIVSHILDGTNYNTWLIAMRMSLDAKNKISFVDGSLPRPEIDDSSFKIWSRCNSMVKAWILNVVSKEIYDSILYYDDAAEMWMDLNTRFKVSNLPRKYQLEQSIITLKQGNLELSAYYTKKKTLWEQLANTKSSTVKRCNCDHVQELLEEAETSRIIQFLMGLNDTFANIRGQILNMKPRPGLTAIYNMLDQDESQRLVGGALQKSFTNPAAAFQVETSIISDQSQVLLAQGGYQKPKCSHCHKLGHTADKCYKLHGYPPGSAPKQKKDQNIRSTNLAATSFSAQSDQHVDRSAQTHKELSKEQIHTMISYLSSKLQTSSTESTSDKNCALTSNSVPVISQILGSYTGVDDWPR